MTSHTFIFKISKVIEKKWNVSFALIPNDESIIHEASFQQHLETARRNRNAQIIYSGNDVLLSIVSEEKLLGVVILFGGYKIENSHLNKLSHFLNHWLFSHAVADVLESVYKSFREEWDEEVQKDNVIYLSDYFSQAKRKISQSVVEDSWGPVLIHSMDSETIKKVAVDLFCESAANGLVPWSALDHEALYTTGDITELGNIMLFVEDISDLTEAHIQLLDQYLSLPLKEESPKIIVGSRRPLHYLSGLQKFPEGLAHKLSTY